MAIACLAWGSLVWDPRELPIASEWRADGPGLPVEFARKSNNGRITLVLMPGAAALPVLWCELRCKTIDEAKAALASREGISIKNADRLIGLWSSGRMPHTPIAENVSRWAEKKALDAVLWTALGPKFSDAADVPSSETVVCYLRSLDGEARELAEQYVRRTPMQIRTAYRRAIEQELGWLPIE